MKKVFLFLTTMLFCSLLFAVRPQGGISHQAVIRNNLNEVVTNSTIGIRVSILQGSESGTEIYRETHAPVSNANGLIIYVIGQGADVTGQFDSIDWANGPYFLKTEADPTGGTSYSISGITQLLSVPFALHARSAENITGIIIENDPVFNTSVAGAITTTDTANWNDKSEFDGQYSSLTGTPSLAPVAISGSYSDLTGQPEIPTNTSQLTNNSGFLTSEVDGSVTNELQALSRCNDTIYLSNGGFVKLPAGFDGQYSSLTGTPSLAPVATSGSYSDLTGQPEIPTNTSQLTNNSGFLTSEVDGSVTNEIQALSRSNDTIYLSNGGFIKLPAGFDGQYSSLAGAPSLAPVATSGSYSDLIDQPTNISNFTNDTGYLTSFTETDPIWTMASSNYYTKSDMQNSGSAQLHFNNIINKPTTLSGYGINNSFSNGGEAGGSNRTLGNTDNYSFGFLTNNTARLHITGDGKVGIGTNSPQEMLDITGNLRVGGYINPSGGISSANDISFFTSGSERLKIRQNGGLVIGDVSSVIGSGHYIQIQRDLGVTSGEHVIMAVDRSAFNPSICFGYSANGSSPTRTVIMEGGGYPFDILTSGHVQALSILNNGNIGVLNADPATALDVSGVITATGGNSTNWNTAYNWGNHASAGYFKNGGEAGGVDRSLGNSDNYTLDIKTNNENRIHITNDGKVGIGTTNPLRRLDLSTTGQLSFGTHVSVNDNAGIYWSEGQGYSIYRSPGPWDNGGSYQQMIIDWNTGVIIKPGDTYLKSFVEIQGKGLRVSSGKVGIGTLSPVNILDVSGAAVIGSTYSGTQTAPTNGLLVEGYVGIGKASSSTALDVNGVITATGGNSTNWNTAYSWGNHDSVGYLKSYTETDPLFTTWNKSTGISIDASQVTDFQTNVSNNSDVIANTAKNSYPSADATKLAGIAESAEVNVNADWNATSGDAQILNKPTLATVATSGSFNDLTNKPAGNNTGDMQYWNGTAWVMVPVGQPGQYLQLTTSNIPAWSGNAYSTLTTTAVSSITSTTATSGGNITSDGGAAVTARGVCWSTSQNPTISDSKTIDGTGTGTFVSSITGLTPGTLYHVRAFATNSLGTAYGDEITFTASFESVIIAQNITIGGGQGVNSNYLGGQQFLNSNPTIAYISEVQVSMLHPWGAVTGSVFCEIYSLDTIGKPAVLLEISSNAIDLSTIGNSYGDVISIFTFTNDTPLLPNTLYGWCLKSNETNPPSGDFAISQDGIGEYADGQYILRYPGGWSIGISSDLYFIVRGYDYE